MLRELIRRVLPGPAAGPDLEPFSDIVARVKRPPKASRSEGPDSAELERNRTHAAKMAQARDTPFEIDGKRYAIRAPEPDFFLAKLRDDSPFAFARLPHGFWDALHVREQILSDPRLAKLDGKAGRALADRIALAALPHHGAFVEGVFDETLDSIAAQRDDPRFFRAVAFKGFPTWDEQLFQAGTAPDYAAGRLRLLARYFAPTEAVWDAMCWKRLAIAGDLKVLPDLCRSRHVILVAADFFAGLDARWRLDRFTYIGIPRALGQRMRWDLLEKLKSAIAQASRAGGPRPIVLTQCGGSLAFWLFSRLFAFEPGAFYIDLGQALNSWFFDVEGLPVYPWMHMYAKPIVDSCGLAGFYKDRLKGRTPAWLQ